MSTLLDIAILAAQKAGGAIMEHYAVTDFDTKTDGSPVTIADHSANTIILQELEQTQIPILSEESTGIALPYPPRLWIIDPLDGTQDFIQKTGDFSVMIGLIENGRPILGVVYAPVTQKTYYATRGGGAFMRHEDGTVAPLHIAPIQPGIIRAIRSRNHHSKSVAHILEHIGATLVPPRGSVGIKAVAITVGEADVYIVTGRLGEWDTCAPEIILTEAGGCAVDLTGAPLFYGTADHRLPLGTLFVHPSYEEMLLQALKAQK